MKATETRMLKQYVSALRRYLALPGEFSLKETYELGREALREGLSLLELAALHHVALHRILSDQDVPEPALETVQAAETFCVELMASYEMTSRGYSEAKAALQESENRYRDLFENANDMLFTTDLGGTITTANKACERLTGYAWDKSARLNVSDFIAPEFQALAQSMLSQKLAGEPATVYELEIITKDGRRVPLEVSTRLIMKDDKPVGVQGIARDVTERKRAQEALLRLNAALEEEAKRIAHELHDESAQLLASVHIAVDQAIQNMPPEAQRPFHDVKALLDQIEAQLRHLSHELRPTILDDLGLLPAIEFLARGTASRSRIPIEVRGSSDGRLPSAAEIALYRVVQEALNNAVKHSQSKKISVRLWRADKKVHCSISDDGAGFDVRALALQKGRRGLGLLGMRERLAAVNGTCTIESSPGQGTQILASVPEEL